MEYAKPKFFRYHYEIGFPKNVGTMCLEFFENFENVQTTFHSANQLMDERNGMIPLPSRADLLHPSNTLVELYETFDKYDMPSGILQKVLIRVHHLDSNKDYAYVVARDGFLISAWANDKNDIHRLERREVYFSNFLKEDIEVPDVLKDIESEE